MILLIKTWKDLEEEVANNDEIIYILDEVKILVTEDKYQNDSINDFKKDYPDKIIELEEAILNYMRGNDLNFLKTQFPYKWRYLTKKI